MSQKYAAAARQAAWIYMSGGAAGFVLPNTLRQFVGWAKALAVLLDWGKPIVRRAHAFLCSCES